MESKYVMKSFELFEIVTNRPSEYKSLDQCKCPYCQSKKLKSRGYSTTLAGMNNHEWHDYSCSDCGKRFTIERKGSNIWMTEKGGRILNGMPSCFESYIYTCSKCGGGCIEKIPEQGNGGIY